MAQDYHMESILVADCGSTTTRVSLIDLAGSEFRLVAGAETSSTVEVPWSRISIAVREAVRQIEELTGRRLLDEEEQLILPEREDGGGVDGFVATVNAAVPLRLAVVGLIRSLSVESLLKAADSSYAVIENVVAVDDLPPRARRGGSLISLPNDFHLDPPDAILVGGGIDGGAITPVLEMSRDIAATLSTQAGMGRVHVVFAGNKDARPRIAQVLGECSELHVVDNVRPTLGTEDLKAAEEEIDRLYREHKMGRAPGFGEVRAWSSAPILPTAEGFGLVLRYLALQYQLDVLGVDVGGATTNIAGVIGGQYGSTVSSELGVSYSIARVLEQAGIERVLRWLPFEMKVEEAHNRVLNKGLRPMTVPETREDLLLEQAIAREAISLTLERAKKGWLDRASSPYTGLLPTVDLIVGRGGVLSQAPQHHQAALILLDALQPTGVCTLALDKASLLPQLGALAAVQPLAAAQVVARDGFVNLGTAISLVGTAREGALALRVKMEYEDGQSIEVEVPYGALEVIPLPAGKKATVELRPDSRFDVGLRKRGKGATTEVEGGSVGLIVDARGRPLSLPEGEKKRREKIQEWMWEAGL
jgi:uncharacterized protein (TIGR01319 family)